MRHAVALAVALAALGGLAHAAEPRFKRGQLGLVHANRLVEARPSYADGTDLIVTLKGDPDAARLLRQGLEARLFPLGKNDRRRPAGWAVVDQCEVFLTQLIENVRANRDGLINLGNLTRLFFVDAEISGKVSPGRYLLVFEKASTYPDPLIRIDHRKVEDYFRNAIYFEVAPSGAYDPQEVRAIAIEEVRAGEQVRTRARRIDPDAVCYAVQHLAEERPTTLMAALEPCAPDGSRPADGAAPTG